MSSPTDPAFANVADVSNAPFDGAEEELQTVHNEPSSGSSPTSPDAADGEKKKKDAKEEEPAVTFSEVFKYSDRLDKALMIIGSLCAFAGGSGLPVFSLFFGDMLGDLAGEAGGVADATAEVALVITYLGIGVLVCCALQVTCWMLSGMRQVSRVRTLFFESVMRQDIGWHDEHKPGELISRMDGDTRVYQNGINDRFATGVYQFGMFVSGFVIGFVSCWELTLLMVGVLPIIAVVGAVMGEVMTKMTEQSREGYAVAGAIATEVMENVRAVQAFGQEEHEVQRFTEAAKPAEAAGLKRELASNTAVGSTYFVFFGSYGIAFLFASYLIEWGRSNIEDITACFFATLFASFGLGLVFPSLSALSESCAAAHKLFHIIDRVPPIDVEDRSKPIAAPLSQGIVFEDVAFAYPTRKDHELFKRLNVTIKKGQTVAFSGVSGSGKSSIIQMLQRFYDPDGGRVLVDGVDMRDIDLFGWRDQIGIVSQEPSLFAGTIADNVRVGKESATDAEVEEACRKANIHDVIMTLPEQYSTNIGTVGSQLSGGQKQRIAIARAIVKNPKILILDEATSALDRKSEVEVQSALDKVMSEGEGHGNRLTVVVIAHRLATIRNADVIHFIVTDEIAGSTIAESGSFDELIAMDGHFAALTRRQSAESAADADNDDDDDDDAAASPTAVSADKIVVAYGAEDDAASSVDVASKDASRQNTTAITIEASPAEPSPVDPTVDDATESFEKKAKKQPVPYLRILAMSGDHWWATVLGILGSVVSGAVYPTYALVFGHMLDLLTMHSDDMPSMRGELGLYVGLFFVVGFGALVGWVLQTFYAVTGEALTAKLRTALFRNILRQDQAFFDTPGRDAGALAGVLAGDCEAVHQLWGPSIGLKLQMACNIGVGLLIAFIYSWRLAVVCMSVVPAIVLAGALQKLLLVGFGHEGSDSATNEDSVKAETFTNIRTVVAFNLQARRSAEYQKFLTKDSGKQIRNAVIVGIVFGATQFAFFGAFALAYWYGGKLIDDGLVSFKAVLICSEALLTGAMGAGEAGGFATKMKDAEMGAKRVFNIIDTIPRIDPFRIGGDKNINPATPADISLSRIEFRYPSRPAAKILKKLSSSFPAGSTNGFMGSTGCGKSTVIQLLARYYEYSKGSITIDGKDLTSLDLVEWRKNMSIVLQEPSLFSGTVRENILYSKPDATEEEIVEAAKLACIHDDILSWPEGYDTDVGYKGRALSGGQKQRVAIARGLLRKPKLLLLDEATSALDNATEAKVQEGINVAYARHPMTVVSVAHRLTTIRDADKIVVMDAGIIIEEGNHDELMALNGEYKTRWELYQGGSK